MKAKLLLALLLILLQPILVEAQNRTVINGSIYDAETKKALPYVNIGFLKESIGTVSDENGEFHLAIDATTIGQNSSLQISYIGYKTLTLSAAEFFSQVAGDSKFYLEPEPFSLAEVVLTNELRKEKNIGSLRIKQGVTGYWLNPEALGGEIATRFKIENNKTKLHDLKFNITKNNSGGIKVRVNVYNYKEGYPAENILTQNIIYEIRGDGVQTINLEPYDILVDQDVVVSLELIEVYGRYIDFEVGGSDYKTFSFTRLYNQDDWERVNQGLMFSLRVSYPSENGKVIPRTRITPKNLTVYWDTSIKMNSDSRDVDEELKLLRKYLDHLNYAYVNVIVFSALKMEERMFSVKDGDSKNIIKFLENVTYDGEVDFATILKDNTAEADAALLFSSGNTIFSALNQEVYLPTYSISSSPEANHESLQKASFYGEGHYINLESLSVNEALERMLTFQADNESFEDNHNITITGKIYTEDNITIPRAAIRVKNTLKETLSDNLGNFSISADKGDILIIDALGMYEKQMPIETDTNLQVALKPNTTVLDEVNIYTRIKQESETRLTPYGEKKVDAIGYTVDELTKNQILPTDTRLDDIIGRIPGVLISGVGANKRYSFLNNVTSTTGMFVDPNPAIVIDGTPYSQGNGLSNLPPIDVQNIKSIRAIKSLAGTNRYGSIAAFGAIEIITQDGIVNTQNKPQVKKENSALVKGNDYREQEVSLWKDDNNTPSYIKELEMASTFKEAQRIYEKQKSVTQMTIPYILNVSDYFKKWDADYSYVVLTNIAALASDNLKALKTLVFKLEERGNFDKAQMVLERILELRPSDAQTYRDLAMNYQETHKYEKAFDLYKRMLANAIPEADFSGLHEVIIDELKHLLALHRSKVDFKSLPADLLKAGFKQDIRLVFEWNDPNTNFELQFVNPQKKYFKWSHTLFDNRDRLLNEVNKEYAAEAYLIDNEEPGEWIINLEAFDQEDSNNPNFLKYTIYKNYGSRGETKLTKVIQLNTLNSKVTLDRIDYK